MKVLVTGAKGQLGSDVVACLRERRHIPIGVDIDEMDITDAATVKRVLTAASPDAVIHCAAWTAVDLAEDENNAPLVHRINGDGTRAIAECCKALGCKMLCLSTDYVFGGEGVAPWKPDCTDYAPLNVYAQSKLEGELAVRALVERFFIVRIAWLFGIHGNNFVKTMLRLAETRDSIRVVNDQIGTPTYTLDVARLLVDMIETERYGYYHATNTGGYLSWADYAAEIMKQAGASAKIIPVSTAEYGLSKAKRPLNSRLDQSKLVEMGFTPLPTWQDALQRYLKEIR